MIKAIERHKKIITLLFSNLKKYVKINTLVEDTEYNWRTIENHIEMMSETYKEKSKLTEIDKDD